MTLCRAGNSIRYLLNLEEKKENVYKDNHKMSSAGPDLFVFESKAWFTQLLFFETYYMFIADIHVNLSMA